MLFRSAYFDCDSVAQGISVGWLDVYSFDLPEQWIDIGPTPLSDGEYVLRVVADPQNLIRESSTGTDVEKEGSAANEGVTAFSIQKGCLAPALLALPLQTCRDPA